MGNTTGTPVVISSATPAASTAPVNNGPTPTVCPVPPPCPNSATTTIVAAPASDFGMYGLYVIIFLFLIIIAMIAYYEIELKVPAIKAVT